MKKNEKNVQRLNLYLEEDLFTKINEKAKAEYLPLATWVKQFLSKKLLKNNTMSNLLNHEQ